MINHREDDAKCVTSNHGKNTEVRRMLAIGVEIRAHMREPVSSDLRDLYDDEGMPL
jgi:hypothetical protein